MWNEYFFNPHSDLIIIGDRGHGENTKGKRSPVFDDGFQLIEFNYNKGVEYHLMQRLSRDGEFNYIQLIPEDRDVALWSRNPYYDTRVRRIQQIKKRFSNHKMFSLSMHGNGAGVEAANGYEVFTSPRRNFSDNIATILFENARSLGLRMRSDWSDGDPDKEAKFAMLTRPVCWAALIETGFFTNYREAKLMATPAFQKKVAKNLTEAFYDIRLEFEDHYNISLH